MYIFTVRGVDYATADEAIKVVESAGQGSVVKFHRTLNPHFVEGTAECWRYNHDSSALWTYDGETWRGHSIFDGLGLAYCEERPH